MAYSYEYRLGEYVHSDAINRLDNCVCDNELIVASV